VVILVLTADFIYARANSAPPSARAVTAVGSEVRIPLSEVQDGSLHLYTITAGNQSLRFLIIKKPNGYGTALDACRICGAEGYRQDGQNVICRHCGSAIYVPSVAIRVGAIPLACHRMWMAGHSDGYFVVDASRKGDSPVGSARGWGTGTASKKRKVLSVQWSVFSAEKKQQETISRILH